MARMTNLAQQRFLVLFSILLLASNVTAQRSPYKIASLKTLRGSNSFQPLDKVVITTNAGETISVQDGAGKVYFDSRKRNTNSFFIGGTSGKHQVIIKDKADVIKDTLSFYVTPVTSIDDGGKYKDMFRLFYKGMCTASANGVDSIRWNGKTYRFFVPWGLDHQHTMKGMKYFSGVGHEFVDLMSSVQREDGMIYSFVFTGSNADYYLTRDRYTGYTKKIGDRFFTRQPTENHPEYIFVNTIYQAWKSDGNDDWMKSKLASATKALEYSITDAARFSQRFNLLKRVYTIDSWDFQVEDEYLPDLGLTNSMIIDPAKSKFGIFFGDNTGYIEACRQLSEMFDHAGYHSEAVKYQVRAAEFEKRLNALAWNGKFFTHFIDEDATVKRNLGVDERTQIAQSNAYTLNRGLDSTRSKAIIQSYQYLKEHLPVGSPGEWYAIYPPFERGFQQHDGKWQYMNGGVGGHVAGELARGSFENGFESYGVDILDRLYNLGKKYNDRIYFAYTGSISPSIPSPDFRTIDLRSFTNMDHWTTGGSKSIPWMQSLKQGDDLRNLPTGSQTFANTPFQIIDPSKNQRRSVIAVSKREGFPREVSVPVNQMAGSVYLLHTSSKPSSEKIVGTVSFVYDDGSESTNYLVMDKHLTYWWFSELSTERSGVAWYGKNDVSEGVGLSWCAIDNPYPTKRIASIKMKSAEDNTIYTVFALTLSNEKHFIPVSPISFGGPDNWAAATAMAALLEGLGGAHDSRKSTAFSAPVVTPRWVQTTSDTVNVCIAYPGSNGYVAYRFMNDKRTRTISLQVTGSGDRIDLKVLLPQNVSNVQRVAVDGKNVSVKIERQGQSHYVALTFNPKTVNSIALSY